MNVTNNTTQDYWFGPLHLAGSGTLTVDDTSDTSLYLTDDTVADAINNLYLSGKIGVTGQAQPFPRPTGEPELLHGDGSPEGKVYAPQGSLYMRRDGTGTNSLYCKTTGVTINTGWESFGSAVGGAGTQWDFQQITASPAQITATTEATAVALITGNSVTYDGTQVKLEAFFPAVIGTTSSSKVYIVFYRDTTVLGHTVTLATTVETGPIKAELFDTPAAGAHTYKIAGYVNAAVTLEAGAGGSGNLLPAFIRVTKA